MKDSVEFAIGRARHRGPPRWLALSWCAPAYSARWRCSFVDADQGWRRRAIALDRLAATFRAASATSGVAHEGSPLRHTGMAQKAQHVEPEHWLVPNDATLAERVLSEEKTPRESRSAGPVASAPARPDLAAAEAVTDKAAF